KVGGILCEFEPRGGPPPAVVVGVGVNLRGGAGDFPPEIRSRAGSLESEGGRAPGPQEALERLLERLGSWCKIMLSEGFSPVRRRWLELCDNLGEEVRLPREGGEIIGRVAGIDERGRLLLTPPEGGEIAVEAGEVVEG
ncbi:MAG: biotin--[acetyl-CoA-carboxylase] ligase, partial [bacterium]